MSRYKELSELLEPDAASKARWKTAWNRNFHKGLDQTLGTWHSSISCVTILDERHWGLGAIMRILCVHGIAQEDRYQADLETEWSASLRKGMELANLRPHEFSVSLPYFGRELMRLADEFARRSSSDDEEVFIESAISEMGAEAIVRPDDNPEYQLYQALDGDNEHRGGNIGAAIPEPARNVLRHLDRAIPSLTNLNLRLFLRVVYAYINIEQVGEPINNIVLQAIDENPREPTLLIGHSLGSVIAYNVLCMRPRHPWLGFLTVGSPLGITAITKRLPNHDPRIPDLTKRCWSQYGEAIWLNAFDRRDVVALNPIIAPFWEPSNLIFNIPNIENQTPNRHGISGYLSDPVLAAAVNTALEPEA
jgi:hypothetical protein